MNQKFTLTGMTCTSCETKVGELISAIPHVLSVEVSLENSEVSIASTEKISVQKIKQILPEKYDIQKQHFQPKKTKQPSKWNQLKPLFLVFIYIGSATLAMNYQKGITASAMMDFMGLFYIVFSFFKLLDLKGFQPSFSMYDPLAKHLPVYGWIYPFLETVLGVMFLARWQTDIALWATVLVLGTTTVGVAKTLFDNKKIQCACLGTALKLPMTEATLIENTVMIVMALLMLFVY